MERISISLDEALAAEFDEYLRERQYTNRSEAIRDLIRQTLETQRVAPAESSECIATLTYVFNHAERALASRLTRAQHENHALAIATLHTHLDHEHCLETAILRGQSAEVEQFAQAIIAQPGVRHGQLHTVAVKADISGHESQDDHKAKPHIHWRPCS
jgi:CopG family nickel-responsive transcriptional regulator